jgi:NitT/TauT family transport system substrate-binding protein
MGKGIWLVIGIILVLAIAGGIYYYNSGSKLVIDQTPVKIVLNPWPGYADVFIAQEKGFFEKNNVKVELVYKQDYTDSKKLYQNNEVDGIFEVYADAIVQNSEGIKSKVIYISDYSTDADVIVGKSEFNSLADLKGKKVGVDSINSFSHMFVLTDLKQNGLKESEIQFEVVSAMEVLNALESGKIDAGHTWEPITSAALAKGYKILGRASDVPHGIITDVLVFNSDFINKNPEKVQAIVKSMVEAREFVKNNKDEAIKIMAKAENMGEEDMAGGLSGVVQPSVKESIKYMTDVNDVNSMYNSGNIISQFYMDRGQMSQKPVLSEIIEPRFLQGI